MKCRSHEECEIVDLIKSIQKLSNAYLVVKIGFEIQRRTDRLKFEIEKLVLGDE